MAAVILQLERTVPGAQFLWSGTITGDTSYPNPAGYVLTPASFGFTVLRRVIECRAANVAAGAYTPVPVITNNADGSIATISLHLLVATTAVEVANAVNVSTAVVTFIVEGN